MADNTFTDTDLIRIFERHLDPVEKQTVVNYFSGVPVSKARLTLAEFENLFTDGPKVAAEGAITIGIFETVLEGLIQLSPFEEGDLRPVMENIRSVVKGLDTGIRILGQLKGILGFTSPFLGELRDILKTARLTLSVLYTVLLELEDLQRSEIFLQELREQLFHLEDTLLRLKRDVDDGFYYRSFSNQEELEFSA